MVHQGIEQRGDCQSRHQHQHAVRRVGPVARDLDRLAEDLGRARDDGRGAPGRLDDVVDDEDHAQRGDHLDQVVGHVQAPHQRDLERQRQQHRAHNRAGHGQYEESGVEREGGADVGAHREQ
ncbi:hypothetical protein D3C86_1783390 [compost metagenome]